MASIRFMCRVSVIRERVKEINRSVAEVVSRMVDLLCLPPLVRIVGVKGLRYIICGVGNYIVLDAVFYYLIYHYLVGESLLEVAGVVVSPHVASLLIVFPLTFMTGFWLNRYVAFRVAERPVGWQMVKYGATVVGSIVLSYVALKLFVERADIWATPAKMLSSVATSLYSYLMARFFTFK